ncbi:MAG: hypothetical protein ABEH38_05035 [Flavobacteriales bacterium]
MAYLASKNGWFVPASELLDRLIKAGNGKRVSYPYLFGLDLRWLFHRIMKKLRTGR